MKKILYTLSFALCLNALNANAANWEEAGERLTYAVGYSFISAGTAEIAFHPNKPKNSYEIVGRAWTNKGISPLMNMSDRLRIEGTLETKNENHFITNLFEARLFENDYTANKRLQFDRMRQQAMYKNVKDGTPATIRKIPETARDIFSALFHLRKTLPEIKVGQTYTLPVVDMTKDYELNVKVLSKETIKTEIGKKQAYKIQPVLKGISKKRDKENLFIWVSADEERTPLRFEINLKLGSFHAEIIKQGNYATASYAPEELPENGETTPRKVTYVNLFDTE